MPDLQTLLTQQKIVDMEMANSYVPTEAQDVVTKAMRDADLATINQAIIDSAAGNTDHDVDGGIF